MSLKKLHLTALRNLALPESIGVQLSAKRQFFNRKSKADETQKVKADIEGYDEKHHKIYSVKEDQQTLLKLLQAFRSHNNPSYNLHRLNPFTMSKQRYIEWKAMLNKDYELSDQKYIAQRHNILGNDLATAHFVVFRGGKVKFVGNDNWIERKKDEEKIPGLPDKFVPNMYLHSIDASNTLIRYEGLENFSGLKKLKYLSFKNCIHVDDWFLDRISGEFAKTLEYLDISDCPGITERGLSCIYRLRNLRTLKITNCANTRSFEFMCFLLEEGKPNLCVEGIKYLEVDAN